MKQKVVELKGKINKSIIIVRDFNTTVLIIDRTNRQKISNDIVESNNS